MTTLYRIDLTAISDPFWSGPHANVECIIDDLIRGGALVPVELSWDSDWRDRLDVAVGENTK